ncbi:MAG: hypothetical protein CMJ19_14015 [Phycisphaeraceae bacterium]|nr:hypothetical protein [Phycisphaeraceae bacterium]
MPIRIEAHTEDENLSVASLSSMIDIIFLLIIFFVVTASFDNAQLDQAVLLPHLDGQTPIKSLPPERLIINVRQDGEVRVGFVSIPPDQITQQLPSILKQSIHSSDTQVILNGDERAKHKYIAQVMEAVAKIGYSNLEINAAVGEQDQDGS